MSVSLWRRLAARFLYVRGCTYRFLGHRSHNAHEYQRAIDDLSRAIESDPYLVDAYYSRGILYWRELRNAYRAIRDLTQVMEMSPGLAEAWFNRAQAHYMRGDYHLAIADLEHYLSIGEDAGWRASAESQLGLLRQMQVEKEAKQANRLKPI